VRVYEGDMHAAAAMFVLFYSSSAATRTYFFNEQNMYIPFCNGAVFKLRCYMCVMYASVSLQSESRMGM